MGESRRASREGRVVIPRMKAKISTTAKREVGPPYLGLSHIDQLTAVKKELGEIEEVEEVGSDMIWRLPKLSRRSLCRRRSGSSDTAERHLGTMRLRFHPTSDPTT